MENQAQAWVCFFSAHHFLGAQCNNGYSLWVWGRRGRSRYGYERALRDPVGVGGFSSRRPRVARARATLGFVAESRWDSEGGCGWFLKVVLEATLNPKRPLGCG